MFPFQSVAESVVSVIERQVPSRPGSAAGSGKGSMSHIYAMSQPSAVSPPPQFTVGGRSQPSPPPQFSMGSQNSAISPNSATPQFTQGAMSQQMAMSQFGPMTHAATAPQFSQGAISQQMAMSQFGPMSHATTSPQFSQGAMSQAMVMSQFGPMSHATTSPQFTTPEISLTSEDAVGPRVLQAQLGRTSFSSQPSLSTMGRTGQVFIVGCRRASQLGGSLLGIPPRV